MMRKKQETGRAYSRPQATRLRMSLTSSSGHTQKFEFFHWLTKNQCAAEMENTKLYAFQFTSGPMAS